MTTTLDAIAVSKRFGGRRGHLALDSVSLHVGPTDAIGIVGESGSGKSTLARIMTGLDRPTTGHVLHNGAEVADLVRTRAGREDFYRTVQYIGQDTFSSFDPLRTIRDAVRLPAQVLLGMSPADADGRTEETVAALGLDIALLDRYPLDVSGGQRQRFSIARSMVIQPEILFCDEVVSALDVSVQGAVLNLLKKHVSTYGGSMVFVSHGLPATAFISTDLVVMFKGEIVEQGPRRSVLFAPQNPYTRKLVDAYSAQGVAASPVMTS